MKIQRHIDSSGRYWSATGKFKGRTVIAEANTRSEAADSFAAACYLISNKRRLKLVG